MTHLYHFTESPMANSGPGNHLQDWFPIEWKWTFYLKLAELHPEMWLTEWNKCFLLSSLKTSVGGMALNIRKEL